MGRTTPDLEPRLVALCREYFDRALPAGEYVAWVAELDTPERTIVGGAGVQFRPLIPRTDPSGQAILVGREGLVMNVHVLLEYRRQGIARRLMETIIAWAPQNDIVRLVLHAAPDGRPLYDALGFLPSNEMYLGGRTPGV